MGPAAQAAQLLWGQTAPLLGETAPLLGGGGGGQAMAQGKAPAAEGTQEQSRSQRSELPNAAMVPPKPCGSGRHMW